MKEIKIKISGMHCASCAMNIDGELEDTPGVKQSSTRYASGETAVKFDEGAIGEQEILAVIAKLGYAGEVMK